MICPICKCELFKDNNTYKCKNNHSFDIAKEGYVNLLISKTNSGDNKESTLARLNFLNNGYYDLLGEELNKIILSTNKHSKVLDMGCGVGYYDKFIDCDELIGLDISKDAIIKASKHNNDNLYVVASSSTMPFSDNEFDLIFAIFAPLYINETLRVLKDDGFIITVTPGVNHLIELKEKIYENPYLNPTKEVTIPNYELTITKLTYQKEVKADDISNLIKMTPYNYKTDKLILDNLNLGDLVITFDFCINLYSPKIKA